jgi:hypothetical protein
VINREDEWLVVSPESRATLKLMIQDRLLAVKSRLRASVEYPPFAGRKANVARSALPMFDVVLTIRSPMDL